MTYDLTKEIAKKQDEFINYTMVRIREALCYFTDQQMDIFFKIPFFLHINSASFPGYIPDKNAPCGIWNFENSEFYKEAIRKEMIPKSEIQASVNKNPAILALYHIGSLGTYMQSLETIFDYWVVIDRNRFSDQGYEDLKKRLNGIVSYASEFYEQKISFSIMDHNAIKEDSYSSFMGQQTLATPKIFLKEKFYRTIMMIGGKIPLWCVLPNQYITSAGSGQKDGFADILNSYDEFLDFGLVTTASVYDTLKGILWHICESRKDPVKALIHATMIFSNGFGNEQFKLLVCQKVKKGYPNAGTKGKVVDAYQALYDHVIDFQKNIDDKQGLELLQDIVFLRLCEYPFVKFPDDNSPKRILLDQYIRKWDMQKKRVIKLLSFTEWPEIQKLEFEQAIILKLAQLYATASHKSGNIDALVSEKEKTNWIILKNKTRERLQKNPLKVPEASTYLKKMSIEHLLIKLVRKQKKEYWVFDAQTGEEKTINEVHQHECLLGLFGWIIENNLYKRQYSQIELDSNMQVFSSTDMPIDLDKLYMSLAPVKPLMDNEFETQAYWSKALILLVLQKNKIIRAELLFLNSWGELILDHIQFPDGENMDEAGKRIAMQLHLYPGKDIKHYFFQLAEAKNPKIVSSIKKAYNDLDDSAVNKGSEQSERVYLDKL